MDHILEQPELHRHVTRVRRFAASVAGVTCAAYLLLGFGAISVFEAGSDSRPWFFAAAALYALGALLLLRYDVEYLWEIGAVLQAMVVAAYIAVATEREPSFDAWGLAITGLQVLLLVVLIALVFLTRRSHRHLLG